MYACTCVNWEIYPTWLSDLRFMIQLSCFSGGKIKFKPFNPNSTPKKHAAFAGNALSMTGVTPAYNAFSPSSLYSFANTSLIPLGYIPSGAVNNKNHEN